MQTPEGLAGRPLVHGDVRAVFGLVAPQEIEEADILGDWRGPSFDVAVSTIGVFDGDTLVG